MPFKNGIAARRLQGLSLREVRKGQRTTYGQVAADSFAEECRMIWKRMSAPDSEPLFRLFFEVYGMALRQRQRYKAFLHDTVEDWLQLIAEPLCREGYKPAEARAFATIVIAGLRGFMLDFCTTHDCQRLDHAVASWLSGLDSMLRDQKKVSK
jgi:hypothetical protein